MGLVLAFQTSPRPASRTPSRVTHAPARPADILFFTGVRYERHGEAQAAPAAARDPSGLPAS